MDIELLRKAAKIIANKQRTYTRSQMGLVSRSEMIDTVFEEMPEVRSLAEAEELVDKLVKVVEGGSGRKYVSNLSKPKIEEKTMKVTKAQLKEMVREVVRAVLDEQFDRGDFEWHQSMQADDIFKKLKQAKMPTITRQKMDQVVSSMEKNPQIRRYLTTPQNTKKIEAAIAGGQFDALTAALEKLVISAARSKKVN